MTNHLNINWAATAEINRREFDSQARWDETYDPTNPLVTSVYNKLGNRRAIHSTEADATVAPEKALRKALHRQQVGTPGSMGEAGRHHVHRKHRSDCPKHLKNQILRGEVEQMQAKVKPTVTVTLPTALPSVLPEKPTTRPSLSRMRSENAVLQKSHPKGFSPAGTFGCNGKASQEVGGHVPKPDTHRLSNLEKEKLRQQREEAYLKSTSETKQGMSRVDALLATKPFHVGRSFAACVTGSYNPYVNQLKRKMEEDHPNFTECNAKVDEEYERYKDQFSWRAQTREDDGGDPRRIAHVKTVPEKLVHDEFDTTHYRRKYDLKTYMEGMRRMGANNLLRDFK